MSPQKKRLWIDSVFGRHTFLEDGSIADQESSN